MRKRRKRRLWPRNGDQDSDKVIVPCRATQGGVSAHFQYLRCSCDDFLHDGAPPGPHDGKVRHVRVSVEGTESRLRITTARHRNFARATAWGCLHNIDACARFIQILVIFNIAGTQSTRVASSLCNPPGRFTHVRLRRGVGAARGPCG